MFASRKQTNKKQSYKTLYTDLETFVKQKPTFVYQTQGGWPRPFV